VNISADDYNYSYEDYMAKEDLWSNLIDESTTELIGSFLTLIRMPFNYVGLIKTLNGIDMEKVAKKMPLNQDYISLERVNYRKFKEIGYIKGNIFYWNEDLLAKINIILI